MTSELKTRRPPGYAKATAVRMAQADAFAADLLPIITSIKAEGIKTNLGIAVALNERGIRTRRGGTWSEDQVRLILKRTA